MPLEQNSTICSWECAAAFVRWIDASCGKSLYSLRGGQQNGDQAKRDCLEWDHCKRNLSSIGQKRIWYLDINLSPSRWLPTVRENIYLTGGKTEDYISGYCFVHDEVVVWILSHEWAHICWFFLAVKEYCYITYYFSILHILRLCGLVCWDMIVMYLNIYHMFVIYQGRNPRRIRKSAQK